MVPLGVGVAPPFLCCWGTTAAGPGLEGVVPFRGEGVARLLLCGEGDGDGERPLELWLSAEWRLPVDWW